MSELLLQLSHNKHRSKSCVFVRQAFQQFIVEDLVVVAATNRIEDIDMAIQRRFDIKVMPQPQSLSYMYVGLCGVARSNDTCWNTAILSVYDSAHLV